MESEIKGCVYFFKHIGLSPIKIGYTENLSPFDRFKQFKTYAPFGAEILGFFQTDDPKGIESKLHQQLASHRLDGEWFEISENKANEIIDLYTSKEQVKLRNDFQIKFANYLEKKKNFDFKKMEVKDRSKDFEKFRDFYLANINYRKTDLSSLFDVSRQQIYNWIKKIE